MSENFAYTSTALNQISPSLDKYFSDLGDENTFARGSNSNFLVPLSSEDGLHTSESILDKLSDIHPSRFFLLVEDKGYKDIAAQISARCKLIAKGEHICTELIRLNFAADSRNSLPSLLRANSLIGSSTELFLHDARIDLNFVEILLPAADLVIFDSERFSDSFFGKAGLASRLGNCRAGLVDLQWVALSAWRDQLRGIFSKSRMSKLLNSTSRINLTFNQNSESTGTAAWLMLGWITTRLGLKLLSKKKLEFEFAAPSGENVRANLVFEKSSGASSGLGEVSFEFGTGVIERLSVVQRAGRLETLVDIGTGYRSSTPLEFEDEFELLKRYFLIGVSTANYRSALYASLELSR